ncbi:MAG: Fur family transcriptional regulator, partial [Casimicrobiaceae bacterium]
MAQRAVTPRHPRTVGPEPAPACGDRRIAHARAHCAARRLNLTPQREAVYHALLAFNRPVKAYELLTRMQQDAPGMAPMTIYRALDFLIEA